MTAPQPSGNEVKFLGESWVVPCVTSITTARSGTVSKFAEYAPCRPSSSPEVKLISRLYGSSAFETISRSVKTAAIPARLSSAAEQARLPSSGVYSDLRRMGSPTPISSRAAELSSPVSISRSRMCRPSVSDLSVFFIRCGGFAPITP